MNDARIVKIIELLEHMRERPAMYAGSKTTNDVGAFLSGFDCGCQVLGLSLSYSIRIEAAEERGWPGSGEVWSLSAMRERGLTEEAMVDEMLAIEIAAWQRLANQASNKTGE